MEIAKYILIALVVNGAIGFLVYRLQILQQSEVPATLGGDMIFHRRKSYRILGALTVAFCLSFLLPLLIAQAGKENPFVLIVAAGVFAWMLLFGIWLMFGKVVVSGPGITKLFPWSRKTIEWGTMEQVQFQKIGGQTASITIFTGKEKLGIDNTYIALEILLQEVTNRAGLEPIQTN